MSRKWSDLVWQAISMFTVGASVGFAVDGRWAASFGLAALGVIALICWGIVNALERD